jgi:hypothetical protein
MLKQIYHLPVFGVLVILIRPAIDLAILADAVGQGRGGCGAGRSNTLDIMSFVIDPETEEKRRAVGLQSIAIRGVQVVVDILLYTHVSDPHTIPFHMTP